MSKQPLMLPLSYETHELSTGFSSIVYDALGMGIDTHLSEEQAATIVLACNAHEELVRALIAVGGYLLNAKIDLETGTPKKTAIQTIEGGLSLVRAAIAKYNPPAGDEPTKYRCTVCEAESEGDQPDCPNDASQCNIVEVA